MTIEREFIEGDYRRWKRKIFQEGQKMKKIWERVVPLNKAGRGWDIKFWQLQSPNARFNAAWGMLKDFYRLRGKKTNADTFRLQRSVENLKQA